MTAALFGGMIADPTSGHFISEKHQAVAEIINDWNPELHLVWIPPSARSHEDLGKEFAIIHAKADGKEYVVRYADAGEIDERLVAWLYEHDSRRTDVMSRLEFSERAERLLRTKMAEDAAAQRAEIAKAVLSSPLHTYTLENGRKIRS